MNEDVEDDFLKAVMIVTEHYVGSYRSDLEVLVRAFEAIGAVRRFDILGHAVFMAMLRADMERLRARRADLVDSLKRLPRPPLH